MFSQSNMQNLQTQYLFEIKKAGSIFLSQQHYKQIMCMPSDWIQVMWSHKHKVKDLFFFHEKLAPQLYRLNANQLATFFNQATFGPCSNAASVLQIIQQMQPQVMVAYPPLTQMQPMPMPVYTQPSAMPVNSQPCQQPVQTYYSASAYPAGYTPQMPPQPLPLPQPVQQPYYGQSVASAQPAPQPTGRFGMFGQSTATTLPQSMQNWTSKFGF